MRLLAIFVLMGVAWGQDPQRIRVTVEREEKAQWTAVNAAHVFEAGDKLRFRFPRRWRVIYT